MRFLVALAMTGCTASAIIGTRGTTTRDGRSLEIEGGVGGGLGDQTFTTSITESGSIGYASNGKLEGHLLTTSQYVSFGDDAGWQAGVITGLSFGAYQDEDLSFTFAAGPHWNLDRTFDGRYIRRWSVALDAGVGYAFHVQDPERADGVLVSLGLSFRFDKIDMKLP